MMKPTEPREPAGNERQVLLSVIVPAYNEAEVLPEFHRRLVKTLDQLDLAAEIVYVNDGSRDATRAVLEA